MSKFWSKKQFRTPKADVNLKHWKRNGATVWYAQSKAKREIWKLKKRKPRPLSSSAAMSSISLPSARAKTVCPDEFLRLRFGLTLEAVLDVSRMAPIAATLPSPTARCSGVCRKTPSVPTSKNLEITQQWIVSPLSDHNKNDRDFPKTHNFVHD